MTQAVQQFLELPESGGGDTFSRGALKKNPWAAALRVKRIEANLTQTAAAKLVRVSIITWKRWERGKTIPEAERREEVLKLLDARSNGLYWEKHKGWVLRLTIDRGPKLVGKREKFYLWTKDVEEALRGGRLVRATLAKLGLQVKRREQRRQGRGVSHRAKNEPTEPR